MNSVEILVDYLMKSYQKEGKTQAQAKELVFIYLKSLLERLVSTDPSIDKQIKRRLETIKKIEEKTLISRE